MLKGKKILITSGGTQEYIDDVRIMTNISSGKLGARIALELWGEMAEVHFIHARGSKLPATVPLIDAGSVTSAVKPYEVISARGAMNEMKRIILRHKIDAVIHCMAVSDFTFERDKAIKCKSNDAEGFIEYMRRTIQPNPKIISMIKDWRPETILIGFKFEVGIEKSELIRLAEISIVKNGCDLVVANDKMEMKATGTHIAHLVYSHKMKELGMRNGVASGKDKIAEKISRYLDKVL